MVSPNQHPSGYPASKDPPSDDSESIPTVYDLRLPSPVAASSPAPNAAPSPFLPELSRQILDLCNDAIIVTDPVGIVQFCNRAAEALYGWPAGSAVGRHINSLIDKLPDELASQRAVDMLRVGRWSGTVEQTTATGQQRWVRTTHQLLMNPQTKTKGLLLVNTDLTQQKRLEQQLVRTQRLESLGALASGIAHDLNNLLTPIRLGVELVESLDSLEEQAEMLRTLRDSVDRTIDMVRQILAFARGAETAELQTISLAPVVRELHRLLARVLPKNIRLSTHIDEGLWAIRGDATQLHQLLLNLCINARDAMPTGGTLALTVTNQPVRPKGIGDDQPWPGPCVCLAVTDTGSGIPPENLDRIFDPYFTTKPPGQGTGLGLASVREITAAHGGLIEVRSELGHGTQFRIYLPSVEPALTDARPTPPRVQGNQETILVVDDETVIRNLIRVSLEQAGYRVLLAQDGAEAIARLTPAREAVALALVDLMLPGMDGQAVIHALRRIKPGLPVVIITGTDVTQTELAKSGDLVLPKPFTIQQLLATIADVLARREQPR
jgi:PAS domain S-box-containing protein